MSIEFKWMSSSLRASVKLKNVTRFKWSIWLDQKIEAQSKILIHSNPNECDLFSYSKLGLYNQFFELLNQVDFVDMFIPYSYPPPFQPNNNSPSMKYAVKSNFKVFSRQLIGLENPQSVACKSSFKVLDLNSNWINLKIWIAISFSDSSQLRFWIATLFSSQMCRDFQIAIVNFGLNGVLGKKELWLKKSYQIEILKIGFQLFLKQVNRHNFVPDSPQQAPVVRILYTEYWIFSRILVHNGFIPKTINKDICIVKL